MSEATNEFEQIVAQLDPLPAERREPVAGFVLDVIGTCPHCDGPIRRCDPRRLDDGQLAHLRCIEEG